MANKLLRVKEVSEMLGVHENTIREWERQGILKGVRVGPRRDRRFREEDVKALMVESNNDKEKEVDNTK